MREHIVLDTNTLISSALFPNSITFRAYEKATNNFKIAMSEKTLAELELVVARPKFDKYLPLEARQEFIEFVKNQAIFYKITETITDCRDPKDDKFLEIAIAATAFAIVTGDEDLLVLHPFRGVLILKSGAFLELNLADY